ncbi:O-antigen ligase domain-containing protein [bacterium]|nr:MAG: O-antigen ligase domain-containing protein [bacterium]
MNFNLKNTIYLFQAVCVTLIAVGVLPRYYAFFIAVAVLSYVLFADWIDALCFSIASIPFYIALPIAQGLDQLVLWRFVFLELFILIAFKQRKVIFAELKKIKESIIKKSYKDLWRDYKIEISVAGLFVLACISLIGSASVFDGAKKLVYYINIFLFYLIIVYSLKSIGEVKRVLKHLAFASAVLISVGFMQLFVLYIVPFEALWEFWASKISLATYGQKFSSISLLHNTWFAFAPSGSATSLRMFSLFSGSLAFATGAMLMLIFPLIFYFSKEKISRSRKILCWSSVAIIMLAIILSGSRGSWVTIIFPFLFGIFILLFKKISLKDKKLYVNKIFISIFIFALLFPLSPLILHTGNLATSSIGRIWSLKNTEEISNKARIEIWQHSFEDLKKHPLTGVGLNNFSADLDGAVYKATSHNMYLYIAVEMGILSVLLVLFLLYFIMKDIVNEFFLADDSFLKMFFFALGASLTWVLGYGFIMDELLNVDKTTLIFVTLVGVFYAIRRIQKRQRDAIGFGGSDVI